jgi:hypothetical protein
MPFASDQVAARAAVEQCARLLGRRGPRPFERANDPDPSSPMRLTPVQAQHAMALDPTPAKTPASYPRAATPMPTLPWTPPATAMPKTPTSINQSNEVARGRRRQRGLGRTRVRTARSASATSAAPIGRAPGANAGPAKRPREIEPPNRSLRAERAKP